MWKRILIFVLITIVSSGEETKKRYDTKMDDVNIFKDIFISIDEDLSIDTDSIFFSDKYKELNIRRIPTTGSLDAIANLKKSKSNISIVRGDVLGIKNNSLLGEDEYKGYGIVCSPSRSLLYLVSKKSIKSITDIRNMEISTGLSSNIAQLYLSDISKNSGISLDIGYNSLNFDDSISALEKGTIDAIFMFGPEDYAYKFANKGLTLLSLPDDFFTNLHNRKGLNRDSYYIDDRRVNTLEVQNFIIAPKTTLDENIDLKVEAMVSAFGCYKTIQNIESFYGDLHPSVKPAFSKIHKRLTTVRDGLVSFKPKGKPIKTADETRYVYYAINDSINDMNITFDEFRTKKFDKIPIRPRHLVNIVPSGIVTLKRKSKKMITFIYKNPFSYRIKNMKLKTIYKNLTAEDNTIEFYLNIGDK